MLQMMDMVATSDSLRSVGCTQTDGLQLREPRMQQPTFGILSCCLRASLGAVQVHTGGMQSVFLRPMRDGRLQGPHSGSLLSDLKAVGGALNAEQC